MINATNNTQNTQDSSVEDELNDIVHDALGDTFCPDCEHPRCLNKVKLYKSAIRKLMHQHTAKAVLEARLDEIKNWGLDKEHPVAYHRRLKQLEQEAENFSNN